MEDGKRKLASPQKLVKLGYNQILRVIVGGSDNQEINGEEVHNDIAWIFNNEGLEQQRENTHERS